MIALVNEKLKSNIFNIPGWHTKRKIVVFESDDWGSIRIPSKETFDHLLKLGYPIDRTSYGNDCLESNEDIISLLEVLSSVKNKKGETPIFTLNFIMANPDFKKIKDNNFTKYYYEVFYDTYNGYGNHDKSLEFLKFGARNLLVKPQLHGREHLNFNKWLETLKQGRHETIDLFKHKMYSISQNLSKDHKRTLQGAFDYDSIHEKKSGADVICQAVDLFQKTWAFNPASFIAPNFIWDDYIEESLAQMGIMYIQGQRGQTVPDLNGGHSVRYHYIGQKNKFNQTYLVRNCYFEPSFDPGKDYVNSCLSEITNAFRWYKPAIISTHRVNYIGSIDPANRDKGLRVLTSLLNEIVIRWPEVEFMTSDQLGSAIQKTIYK